MFGATIGFLAGRFKDFLDARQVKKSFMKAIRLELASLKEQLSASLAEVNRESALPRGWSTALSRRDFENHRFFQPTP
jgi:hypothetical protein